MIRHIVMWKLKDFAEGNDKQANAIKIKKMLEALADVVPGAFKMEVGLNFSPAGYDVVLCAQFSDQESLNGYQVHPNHMRVKEFLNAVSSATAQADYMI